MKDDYFEVDKQDGYSNFGFIIDDDTREWYRRIQRLVGKPLKWIMPFI